MGSRTADSSAFATERGTTLKPQMAVNMPLAIKCLDIYSLQGSILVILGDATQLQKVLESAVSLLNEQCFSYIHMYMYM